MNFMPSAARVTGKARRFLGAHLNKRMSSIGAGGPVISFTFDDAPKSAFGLGREILGSFGARPTYYVSLGLLDSETEAGRIGSREDMALALSQGSELGCHTYDHLDAWHCTKQEYMASVARNRQALDEALPGSRFVTFAYPKSGPTFAVKSAVEPYFSCCRGGGQTFNEGAVDLNLLSAVFLDQRTNIDAASIRKLVDDNAARRGWLIFATHDIAPNPTRYGCAPDFLEFVASYSKESDATFLPVGEACARLTSDADPLRSDD